jgi:glycosyltransferase involved in cell wall biosynthesis
MNIAICARTWGNKGGIGVYTRNLTLAMLSIGSGHQYTIFYKDKAHVGNFSGHENVKEIFVPAYGKLMWDQIAIPYYASKEKVDILFHPKFFLPFLYRHKTVMTIHGTEALVYPQLRPKSDWLYFRIVFPLFLRKANAIISVSHNARNDVIRLLNIDPGKIRTIRLAPDSRFKKINDHPFLASVRKKYNLPERFILNVGLHYAGKNIPNLLKALKLVHQTESIKLVLVGGDRWPGGRRREPGGSRPSYESQLSMIHDLGLDHALFLPGYIPHEDLVAVYNLATMVVHPSFYESFPAIPLEAMACGCPVVISHTGGSPEAAGEAARYVDPWNVEDIADGIRDVLTNSRLARELVQRGFAQAQRFSWYEVARKTLQFFDEISRNHFGNLK